MATIIKIKKRQVDKLYDCAEKMYKSAKKLMSFVEEEFLDEDMDERDGGGGYSGGGGRGNMREEDEDMDEDDDEMNERRGVPGTGRYGRRRYGRRR